MTPRGVALLLLTVFALCLLFVVLRALPLFFRRHGRAHRLLGVTHLLVLAFGLIMCFREELQRPWLCRLYDAVLGTSGLALTLSAARDFGRRRVQKTLGGAKRASGALDEDATVSRDEMVEHAFYHGLLVAQVGYLHVLPLFRSQYSRLLLCALATSPWLLRSHFPVHSFSANYVGAPEPWSVVSVFYRIKKVLYLLYKHVLLHGLNVSAALQYSSPASSLALDPGFRLFWLCLNSSYVLEFFLQSMVKRQKLSQQAMLLINALLMAASSVATVPVLPFVQPGLAAMSLVLNLLHRRHDVTNTAAIAVCGLVLDAAM